eukprot:3997951-Amphidinium_carterae.1
MSFKNTAKQARVTTVVQTNVPAHICKYAAIFGLDKPRKGRVFKSTSLIGTEWIAAAYSDNMCILAPVVVQSSMPLVSCIRKWLRRRESCSQCCFVGPNRIFFNKTRTEENFATFSHIDERWQRKERETQGSAGDIFASGVDNAPGDFLACVCPTVA